jgi:hypothetical protein
MSSSMVDKGEEVENVNRLEGSNDRFGGLIIRKITKESNGDKKGESVLGLDRLAKEKKRRDERDEIREEEERRRAYRPRHDESPSNERVSESTRKNISK